MERNGLNRIFVDTGFIIALINERDQYYQQAIELSVRFECHPFLTTDAVLLVGNALVRNYKRQAIEIIEQFLDAGKNQAIANCLKP